MLYAASSLQFEIVKQLLDFGADPNQHSNGFTPLMALCNSIKNHMENEAFECLNILLQAKADVNATNKNRENALMLAMKLRSPEFIEKLVSLTENLDLSDSDGNTALHYAVMYNRPEVVKLLLQYKANTLIRNRHGVTAYDSAIIKQYENIRAMLTPGVENNDKTYEVMSITKWQDLFPDIATIDDNKVLQDISTILFGMGLERYNSLFVGMSLKQFLNLTDEDLIKLGMDLSIHRNRFIEDLEKFHNHQWNSRSLGFHKTKNCFKIFDGVISLGNIVKKFCVIGSSFNYIKRNIVNSETNSLLLTPEQKKEYEIQIKKTEETMTNLKKELHLFKQVAKQIESENRNSYPATYIFKKRRLNWPVIITAIAILGFYVSKSHIHRLPSFK